jgi:glycine/D-amino acid oxidase-like deaminating enzyme
MAGCQPDVDGPVAYDDFTMNDAASRDIFEDKVWPALVNRIPAFERIRVTARWAGHYAYNTVDQNAIVGPHHEVGNFIYLCGFSGHGMQQAPAMGRGVAELIGHGAYRSLDLTPLGFERIVRGQPFVETAII